MLPEVLSGSVTFSTSRGKQPLPTAGVTLILLIISPTGEIITQKGKNRIEIQKESGKVVLEANVPLAIKKTKRDRVFNMVPGKEAIPIQAFFKKGNNEIVCTLTVV